MKVILGKMLYKLSKLVNRFIREYEKTRFKKVGENFVFLRGSFTYENIECGDNVYIGEQAIFLSSHAKIIIGNNVMFGPHVFIVTGDHRYDLIGEYMYNVKDKHPENDKDVVIEDDVWIGMGVIILKGVRIGKGAIVGAGSIVSKDIPPYTIHVGSSSLKEIPRFSKEKIIEHERIINQKYGKA